MKIEPFLIWPANCNPRIPSEFRKIVEVLESAGAFRLLDTIPTNSGPRIEYETSSTLGVLDTISYRGWNKRLSCDEHLASVCSEIIRELAIRESSGKFTRKEQVPFSCVARRNIAVAGYEVDSRDPVALFRFLTSPSFRIPRASCLLPVNLADIHPLVPCGMQQVDRFCRDTRLFFESKYTSSVIRNRVDAEDSELLPFNMFKEAASRRVVTASSGVEDDENSECEVDDVSLLGGSFGRQQYLSGCLAGDILARNPAQLELAVALVQFVSTISRSTIACLYPGEIASWIIAMLTLGFGISPADAFRIKTDCVEVDRSFNYPACLDLKRSRLILLPGNGYEESLDRRIQRSAYIEIELRGVMAELCRTLAGQSSGKTHLEEFIENPASDRFVENIYLRLEDRYTPVTGRAIGPQIMRLASANNFSALIFADARPAHHALLSCKATNPWRSDSNYISVSRESLQNTLTNIWKSLWDLAECNPEEEIPKVINPEWVGASVPKASELFDAIRNHGYTP